MLCAGRTFVRCQCGSRHIICCVCMCNVSLWYWTRCFTAFINTKSWSASRISTQYAFFL